MSARFTIRRSALIQPLLVALGGGTRANSYVEVGEGELSVKFGWMSDNVIAIEDVASVVRGKWPWWGGLGWRTTLRGTIALVGSYRGIVEIRLRRKQRLRFILPFWRLNCDRLVVSLEEPEAFLASIQPKITAAKS